MTEHPIIFSTPMVAAVLAGRKSQTRRVLSDQGFGRPFHMGGNDWQLLGFDDELEPHTFVKCPYGPIGTRLWVREKWAGTRCRVCYAADGMSYGIADAIDPYTGEVVPDAKLFPETVGIGVPVPGKWRPSIHMPRWACRLFLIVDDVRVQRVQDITEEDAMAEGCRADGILPRDEFAVLWDVLNAKRGYGWDANPWVWAIRFHREIA